ncbi:MAG TPA: PAS domain-containing protein [Thermohalobaculum sp.]|nr:PAS domain-containing protein [Thermohalobaculum sp.]
MVNDVSAHAEKTAGAAMAGKDGIVHAQTRLLLSYWQELRRGQLVPFRSQIDPRHMRCDIGNLFILEALPDGQQRFRVAGSRIVDMFGMELRGMPARTIAASGARDELRALIGRTLEEPGIGYARLRPETATHGLWEMLLLPLRSDGGSIDRAIGFMFQLAGSGSLDTLVPLRLVFERRTVERVAGPAASPGFGEEEGEPFRLDLPDGPRRLTALEGGGGTAGPRRRPKLRVIGRD